MADLTAIAPLSGFGLANVVAGKSADPAKLSQALGAELPSGPQSVMSAPDCIIGVGPDRWLVLRESVEGDLVQELESQLDGLAMVVDQSSAYALWQLRGEHARDLLQRGVAIDLHPASFPSGSVAVTQIAHIGVTICQTDDAPTYLVACYRSFASNFEHWMREQSAALR